MTLYINLPVAILEEETEAFTCFLLSAINSLRTMVLINIYFQNRKKLNDN
jgi:hypothetical protein